MSEGMRRKLPALALAAVVALYLAAASGYVAGERPNQDEGWYLYAARQVRAGQRPYLDFAYVQPPLLPYVYGALGADRSVSTGRSVSALFGALTVFLVGLAAWRAGAVGGLTAAALLALTPFVLSQQSIVKAYALANALLALGLLLAVTARGQTGRLAAAAVAFGLAALARNSAAPALVAYWLWLAMVARRAWLPGLLAGGGTFLVGLLPFLLADAGAVRYHLLEHHAANAPQSDPATLLVTVIAIAGIMVRACPALAGLALAGPLYLRSRRAEVALWPEIGLAALVTAFVFLGHFASGHPYQEYQVLALPAAAVLAGLAWGEAVRLSPDRALVQVVLAIVAGLVPFLALPPAMADLPGARSPEGVFGPLRQVAALVRQHCPADQEIFTFQTDVAIEAQCRLSPGLGLASFSFSGDPAAERHHLVNPASITRTLAARQPAVVVLSPGDLANLLHGQFQPDGRLALQPGLDPAARATYGPLIAALDAGYRLVGRVEGVGQFAETFHVLARRAP